MAKFTIALGVILVLLGLIASAGAPPEWAVQMPFIAGAIFLVSGAIALKESLRKHAMHLSSLAALVFAIASLVWFIGHYRGASATMLVITGMVFLLTTVYLGMCINSFVQARKRRKAAG